MEEGLDRRRLRTTHFNSLHLLGFMIITSFTQLIPASEGFTDRELKGLNRTGVFPEEFANLPCLKEDLSRNYINGTLPSSLSKLPLVILLISGNDLTGIIPPTFGKLKNLTDFHIDGHSFFGTLPSEIENLQTLTRLDAQGANLKGQIPATLSRLTNLIHLRISDLSGPSSTIPDLQNLTRLETILLRNCKLTGTIPHYLGSMKTLKLIDLSFHQLTSTIPDDIRSLNGLDFMFLTNNSLGGAIPSWMPSNRENYWQQTSVNLVSSFSTSMSNSVAWCLRKDLPCSEDAKHQSLFIDCGGNAVKFEGIEYEEDLTTTGPSHFVPVGTRWAYSSTGVFVGNGDPAYRATNTNGFNLRGN